MKKLIVIVFILIIFVSTSHATTQTSISADGNLGDWEADEEMGTEVFDGKNFTLWLTWENYFNIGFERESTNWFLGPDADELILCVAFDTDHTLNSGSTTDYYDDVTFTNPQYLPDLQVLIYAEPTDLDDHFFFEWNGSSWEYTGSSDIPQHTYYGFTAGNINDEVTLYYENFPDGWLDTVLAVYVWFIDNTGDVQGSFPQQNPIGTNPSFSWYYLFNVYLTGVSPNNPSYTLPVELSAFTAQYLDNKPTLYWSTQTETDNMGWFVYRNQVEDFTSATQVSGMIEGHGTTTQVQSYIYEDVIQNPQVGEVYYYWLESVDYSGTIHHFDRVAMITIPEINVPHQNLTPPPVYDLTSSPNPFNEKTNITFMLTQTAFVDVAIYDVKGALVKSFDTQHITAETLVLFEWNGKDEHGKNLSNGIYLYSVKVNGQDYATKQVILMK